MAPPPIPGDPDGELDVQRRRAPSLGAVSHGWFAGARPCPRGRSWFDRLPDDDRLRPELVNVVKVYPVIHVTSAERTLNEIEKARRHAIDGVFLIDHDANDGRLIESIRIVAAEHADLFLGANLIRRPLEEALTILREAFGTDIPLAAIWADKVEALEGHGSEQSPPDRCDWNGLHFGGVAFKYQKEVPIDDLPALGAAATHYVDVATTSGPATGRAVDLDRLKALRQGLGHHPVALASGVTPGNVRSYLGLVDHVMVATGIALPDGSLDEAKLEILLTNARASQ